MAGSPGKYAYFTQRWEKGSDVNLASMMLADGFRGDYEVAVVSPPTPTWRSR